MHPGPKPKKDSNMTMKFTYIVSSAALLMASLSGVPGYAAGGNCETDPKYTCIEVPDGIGELPDPHIAAPAQGGDTARPTKSGQIYVKIGTISGEDPIKQPPRNTSQQSIKKPLTSKGKMSNEWAIAN